MNRLQMQVEVEVEAGKLRHLQVEVVVEVEVVQLLPLRTKRLLPSAPTVVVVAHKRIHSTQVRGLKKRALLSLMLSLRLAPCRVARMLVGSTVHTVDSIADSNTGCRPHIARTSIPGLQRLQPRLLLKQQQRLL